MGYFNCCLSELEYVPQVKPVRSAIEQTGPAFPLKVIFKKNQDLQHALHVKKKVV